jgi:hypothetical protein
LCSECITIICGKEELSDSILFTLSISFSLHWHTII